MRISSQQIFDSGVILLTTFIISWTVVWMQGYTQKIKNNLSPQKHNINIETSKIGEDVKIEKNTILKILINGYQDVKEIDKQIKSLDWYNKDKIKAWTYPSPIVP